MRKVLSLSLSLIGLFDSLYLWWVYTSPSRPMVCVGNGCDIVRMSPLAYPWGIPMPIFGVAMYAALALLVFAEPLFQSSQARIARLCVVWTSGLGFVASLYLTGVEAFVIHAWCFWCVISAIVVTLIFGLAILDVYRPLAEPVPEKAAALTRNHLAVVVAAVTLGIPAFILLSRSGTPPRFPGIDKGRAQLLVRPDSHIAGNPQASLTVVEFGDIQCPACSRAEEAARDVRGKYGDRVRFVFRNFPLPSLHPQALKAAEAAECAGAQGKFWEALERFYAGQADLGEESLIRYAGEVGLDQGEFRKCLSSGAMAERVQSDANDARMLGLRATPTFIIGQQVIEGPIDKELFGQLIRQELARAASSPQASNPTPQPGPGAPGATSSSGFSQSPFGAIQLPGASTGCSEADARKQQAAEIKTPEARQLFQGNPKPLFVDVRESGEFAAGHIAGAVNVPADRILGMEALLPKYGTIILYESGKGSGDNICAAGRAAGRDLLANGYSPERVKVYLDGLEGWTRAGLPTKR